jgi:hypothetical protein
MEGKELKSMEENWLNTQTAVLCDEGIQTLVPHCDKCLNFSSEKKEN